MQDLCLPIGLLGLWNCSRLRLKGLSLLEVRHLSDCLLNDVEVFLLMWLVICPFIHEGLPLLLDLVLDLLQVGKHP